MTLRNGNFEADWEEQSSHEAHVFVPGGDSYIADIGEIHTPPHWMTWFLHDAGTWDQPEVGDAWKHIDPRRVMYGEKAVKLFTFYRRHRGGLYQRVAVTPGQVLEFSVYCHAWSNHDDDGFPHPHDGRWSEGVGYDVASISSNNFEPPNGDPQHDAIRNFTFSVGIDPTGGIDPFAETAKWSEGYANYNGYLASLAVGATAESGFVTVFIESMCMYGFCHSDAYFDEALLEVISEPEPPEPEPDCRGKPRAQYERTYNVIPATATEDEAVDIFLDGWRRSRETTGGSYDDAGIGDLDVRKVRLHGIPVTGVDALRDFYDKHYPGCALTFVGVVEPPEPEPPEPTPGEPQYPDPGQLISLHSQAGWRGDLEFIRAVKPSTYKLVLGMERAWDVKAASPNTRVVYRPYTKHQSQYLYHVDGPRAGAQAYINTFIDSVVVNAGAIDYVESLNEEIETHNLDKLRLLAQFEIAFCDLLALECVDVGAVILTAAVGNPDHDEVEWMIPAVQACVDLGGALGYHGYWNVHNQESQLVQDWYHHAGRALESWDPVFRAAGLFPRYIFGECGAVEDMKPNDGWKVAYNLEKYLDDVLLFRSMMTAWNAEHGNRVIGATLFTLGGGDVWREFEQGQILGELAAALT